MRLKDKRGWAQEICVRCRMNRVSRVGGLCVACRKQGIRHNDNARKYYCDWARENSLEAYLRVPTCKII